MQHTPVLLWEVLSFLQPQPGQTFVDGTVGLGGHAEAILRATAPDGRMIAIDRDKRNLELARERLLSFRDRVVLVEESFGRVKDICYERGFHSIHGALLDLGFSSAHIEDARRGFSFQSEGPLDMRYDTDGELTAEMVVNRYPEEELARIFHAYGEERASRRVAKAVVVARKKVRFTTTTQLADFVAQVLPRRGRLHPATKVFQALRIEVNKELEEIDRALPDLLDLLVPGGRLAVITFHSVEDRLVKQMFRRFVDAGSARTLTKHVIKPTLEEMQENPRARSAKLRVLERYDLEISHHHRRGKNPQGGSDGLG